MTANGNRVEVIYDIETTDMYGGDPSSMTISIVSAYRRELNKDLKEVSGEMRSFWTPEAFTLVGKNERMFDDMWEWFEEADRIIGYNSFGFDNPIMNVIYKKGDFTKLKHFDVMDVIRKVFGHRVKLDSVAKESVGVGKNASGGDAVTWWGKRDAESLANLKKYCEMDVEVTKKVYDFGMKTGTLRFKDHWNEPREIEVDFSYPVEVELVTPAEVQMGLF